MPTPTPITRTGLTRWERRGLVALAVLVLLHAVHVERRSVFMQRRMTDLGVYLRAAWAVRADRDLYQVTDENDFHYVYPPLLAILLTPLADPPPGLGQGGVVPFAVSVGLWYVFSVLCAWWAAHGLASALEQTSPDPAVRGQRPRCWRWWALRVLPLLVCLPPILGTLVHGQVNLLLLALLSGMAAALLRGRSWRAGFFLAGAICLKVFPAFLVLYPLWRRDGRCLAGCAVGLLLGLALIPSAVWGPAGAWEHHRRFAEVVLLPGLGQGGDQTVAEELTNVTATDSQSLLAVLHNTLHPDRWTRPPVASAELRRLSYAVGGLLTAGLLLAAGWRRLRPAGAELAFLGALTVNMLLLCPVCHLPYFCLLLPLVMALVELLWIPGRIAADAARSCGRPGPRWYRWLAILFAVNFVARTLPHVPGLQMVRDLGLSMYAAVPLWLMGVWSVWRCRAQPLVEPSRQADGLAA